MPHNNGRRQSTRERRPCDQQGLEHAPSSHTEYIQLSAALVSRTGGSLSILKKEQTQFPDRKNGRPKVKRRPRIAYRPAAAGPRKAPPSPGFTCGSAELVVCQQSTRFLFKGTSALTG